MNKKLVVESEAGGQAEHVLQKWGDRRHGSGEEAGCMDSVLAWEGSLCQAGAETHCVAQADLKLKFLLPEQSWDYRPVSSQLVCFWSF